MIYESIIFDCDGVLLNSNYIKTNAFYEVALPYGEKYAFELMRYHKAHGGVSRQKKLDHFIKNILKIKPTAEILKILLRDYSDLVYKKLMESEICEDLVVLKEKYFRSDWFVVSGGNQQEIEQIFEYKGIKKYFNAGIYGNPKSKDTIFQELIKNSKIKFPAIYLGDSRYDYEVAKKFGLDFVFVYGWTEFLGWEEYCSDRSISVIEKTKDLVNLF